MDYSFPNDKKQRLIVNTDAKNEADDQYAVVHAVLTPSFELHGIIPAHFEAFCRYSYRITENQVRSAAKTPSELQDFQLSA